MSLDDMKKVFSKSQRDICIEELDKLNKIGYSNDYVRALQHNIDKVTNVNLTSVLGREPTRNEVLNYWAYYFYTECKLSLQAFVRVNSINESNTFQVNAYNYIFEWNVIKAELSLIKHNLRFIDAISILVDSNTKKFRLKKSDRCASFAFNDDGVFLSITVEMEEGKKIRIVSFRESNKDEFTEIERSDDYERLA